MQGKRVLLRETMGRVDVQKTGLKWMARIYHWPASRKLSRPTPNQLPKLICILTSEGNLMLCKKLRRLANGQPFSTADVAYLVDFEEEPKQQPEKEEQSHIES